jgi:dTDP-glucose pyrophosphorylase
MMEEKPLILQDGVSFNDAVRKLAENGNGYLAVVDCEHKLIGIVTDADIRRAALKRNFDFESVINRTPKVLPSSSSKQQIVNYLKRLHRRHMPLVNDDGTYAGVFSLDQFDFNHKPNTVVIMAGGLGSRMGELTKNTPKPMLKVGDRPVLERIIEHFAEQGFIHFLISVNYKKEVIKDYFLDGREFGVEISYLEEDKRLGTAGALSLIDPVPSESFIVVNGDVLSKLDHEVLLDWHLEKGSDATMCVREYAHQIPYGVVNFSEQYEIEGFEEKPRLISHINAGIYVISPKALDIVPSDKFYDMPTLFTDMMSYGMKTCAYVASDYWIDIGLKEQYLQANNDFEIIK